jgi:glucose-6-phosphate isomerase
VSAVATTLRYAPAATLAAQLLENQIVQRIWDRDIAVWGAADGSADARSIKTRLGWLDAPAHMSGEIEGVLRIGGAAADESIGAVYLLGMGGSSLCAEVMRSVYGVAQGHPELFVLDTTDERTITAAANRMDAARTWFLVASKSGGTVEVTSMERFFWARMSAALGPERAGRQFIAITDPGTALEQLARSRAYREIFLNPPDIGGRFSAVSLFGLVPAALLGAPVKDLLAGAAAMAEGCRQHNHANAGLELGAFIGASALEGRDKLTIVLPPSLATLGLWIEQLVAESTGKHGKGSLPVVDEPLAHADVYGDDRAFVAVATERDAPDAAMLKAIEQAGHPVLRLTTRVDGLGAEFFRWEFATAVAGAVLGINPFDEPNVAEAKDKTKALLAAHAQHGKLPSGTPAADSPHGAVFSSTFSGSSPAAVVRAAASSAQSGDYVAFLSYLPADSDVHTAVDEIRAAIRAKMRAATTFGVGPRYLHSTGQYHKGGPNSVVAFVITADDETETPIPEAGYSFAVLKRAQALGDMQTLEAHSRRSVRIHLKGGLSEAATRLAKLFEEALK